jgi:hypothetical protein
MLFAFGVGALLVNWILTRAADCLARRAQGPDGIAFEAGAIRPRIQIVRTDFAAQSSLRNMPSSYHEQLMESAREAISKMEFFQSRMEAERR